MNQVTRHPRRANRAGQFFVVGNLLFALLLCGGVAHSLIVNGRLPQIRADYADSHQHLIDTQTNIEVMPALRTAAAINFDDGFAQLQLLSTAYAAHDTENIIRGLRGLLNHSPDDSELHGELAIALHGTGQLANASVHSSLATKLNPDSAGLQMTHGAVLMALGRNHEAAACYRRALELNPEAAPAQRALKYPLKNY